MAKFKVGNAVRFTSGGLLMTVEAVYDFDSKDVDLLLMR